MIHSSRRILSPIIRDNISIIFFVLYSTPFNESTYIGWAFNFFLQMVSGLIFILVNLSTVTFVIAIGLYFEACTKHFRVMFMDLNQIAGQNATIKMRLKMKSSIVAAIHFHRTTKRYWRSTLCTPCNEFRSKKKLIPASSSCRGK